MTNSKDAKAAVITPLDLDALVFGPDSPDEGLEIDPDDNDDGQYQHWIDPNGTQHWKRHHYYHRDGGLPALVYPNGGGASWYVEGKLHRDGDLPAMINAVGMYWYQNGKLHREDDLPAIIIFGGGEDGTESQVWFEDGLTAAYDHSIDLSGGGMCWYRDGRLERKDGLPAIVLPDGTAWWAVDGKPSYSEKLY